MFFSKSKYCGYYQCPKITWLKKNKPEEYVSDSSALARMQNGRDVGELAKGLFGDFVDVTTINENELDLQEMILKTKAYIKNKSSVICEASFDYDGLYCAVDILKKEKDGYSIYEVKSSTDFNNYIYIVDISYQKYVLEKCGIKVISTNLININNEYVYNGQLDINQLFKITNVDKFVNEEVVNVEKNLLGAKSILEDNNEPTLDLHVNCNTPYKCGFWKYCSRHLPNPSVFDLYGISFKNKLDYYKNNILSFNDLINKGDYLGPIQNMQITYGAKEFDEYIDKEGIEKFLKTLSYPLYFLDFETMQLPIPKYINTRPYQQIPFQYSLHYIDKPNGKLKHKEFLADSGVDPRKDIAESLCKDIPQNVCVVAYNKEFECGRISELANMYPHLKDHLMNISMNMKDLIVPFRSGYCYNKRMGGSFSIKSVLPALFPDDPSLDYHNLEGVHNGGEAMAVFPLIKNMSKNDQLKARKNLLKYCELDTFAMVKIYEYLVNIVKG